MTAHQLKKSLEQKLGIEFRSGDEFNGWFTHGGKKILRVTVPKGRKTLTEGTLSSIKRQLKIRKEELNALVNCPLRGEDYIKILSDQGFL